MANQGDRLAALEQENQGLRSELAQMHARLAHLEASAKPAPATPARPPQRSATITYHSQVAPSANLPTEQEAELLLDRVRAASSKLRDVLAVVDEQQQAKLVRQFRNSFAFVTAVYRRDKVNTDVDGLWWVTEAREFLRNARLDSDVSWATICAATVACGDTFYTGMIDYPYVYLGLARGARGRYDPIFRDILAGTRNFLPPIQKVARAG